MRLELDGQAVQRDVATLEMAAIWVESWLASSDRGLDRPPNAEGSPTENRPTSPSTARPDPARTSGNEGQEATGEAANRPSMAPAVPARAQLGLLATAALADEAIWGGGEASVRLPIASSIWLGVAMAGAADTGTTGPTERVDDTFRWSARASARGGSNVSLGGSVDLILGVGVGVLAGVASRQIAGDSEEREQGALFGEGFATMSVPLGPRFSFLGGVAVRGRVLSFGSDAGTNPLEADIPTPIPVVVGEALLGVGYEVGGSP